VVDKRNYPMPAVCSCGGSVEATGEVTSTIVQDIPPPPPVENVRHSTPVGQCSNCGRRVCTKLPGALPNGESVAAVQVGPNAQALMLELRFEEHVSLRGISRVLRVWHGLEVTAGGISQIITRQARRMAPSYEEARTHVRASSVVSLDETGMRQDGLGGWAWLARTDTVSFFQVERSRGAWVADAILGAGFLGVVCSDFYVVYTVRDDWTHQYCGAHLIREVRKIAEVDPNPRTETFRDEIVRWYVDAKRAQACGTREQREDLKFALATMSTERPTDEHPEVQRLADRIATHFDGVVYFLDHRKVRADNNAAERDIRPLALHRKVTGGTRSDKGSYALSVWMTVTQTLKKNDRDLREYVHDCYLAHLAGRPPPSLFAST